MDLESIILSEISYTEKEEYLLYDLFYSGILKQTNKNWTHSSREQNGGCQRQEVGGGWIGEGSQKVQTSSYKNVLGLEE